MQLYSGPECPRCHHGSKLAVVVQKLGMTPEARFYECANCNHLFTLDADLTAKSAIPRGPGGGSPL